MSNILRIIFGLIVLTSVRFKNVCCDQPKFTSHEGNFFFQSAQDKNITIRLGGSSKFLINNINVMDSLQKVSSEQSTPVDEISIKKLPTQVQVLKTDVQSFTNRLRRFENRTSFASSGRITRLQSRFLRLINRVNAIKNKLKIDDCEGNPCKNGGTCYDLYMDFHCECPNTWTGKTCETDVDECQMFAGTDLGCQNKAICLNLPGSYGCTCTNGFVGPHCRDRVADCTKSGPGELCGNGQCIPANNALGYKCICNSGWKVDNVTQSCNVDVNECLESMVACHTSCINLPGSFKCGSCPSGYTGDGVICRDINECERNNGGCSMLPKVQCINTEGSYRCGNCPPGWTGDGRYCSQAETYTCESNNICHPLAKCEYISNVMVCMCPEGMTGSGYGQGGCRSGSANPCNEHNCQNGGTCVDHGGTATCVCSPGFEPPNCQVKDPCSSRPCYNGGTCQRIQNTSEYSCTCTRQYMGAFCQNRRSACGGVITDRHGELSHPPDGNEYKPNEACAWVIRTDPDLILNVTFSHFDIQLHPMCSKDWLQINDGRSLATPVIGRFCGRDLPKGGNILSSHSSLFFWFRTDNTTNGAGFSFSWTSATPICGGRMILNDKDHGVIKSPGYPGKSPPNRDCQWELEAPMGKRILFRFFEVVLERSDNCTKDALLIYDTNELLEQVCETGIPPPKYSSTNSVKLHFHTDAYRQDSMFQVHYEVVEGKPGCGGLLTEPTGKILFTQDLSNCVFLIQQPIGLRVSVAFSSKSSASNIISFRIYDGKSDESPVLAMTSGDISPGNYTSTGNFMLIVGEVDQSNIHYALPGTLYEANYKRVCGEELRDPLGGVFMTPNYPKPYYAALDCVYTIVGPLSALVYLNITDYDISEYSQGCDDDADFIELYYTINNETPQRYCKGEELNIVTPSNYLNIVFHSNTNFQKRRGISASYYFKRISCGGVLRDTEGHFDMMGGTSSTIPYCEWILEAPRGTEISLDLIYTRTGLKCVAGEADLKIFLNGTGTGEGRMVESHCGDQKRIVTILPSNVATVVLFLKPASIPPGSMQYRIQADYKFIPRSSSCGGNYSLLSGSIQSPNWPDQYKESMDCVWVIHAALGNKIELIPRNFSLEPSYQKCYDDYLEIRNGMTEEAPLIGKFCGYYIPPHIPSFTNHMYLHFHSDSSLEYPGFDITFQQTTTGCGGSLTSHTGSITSPHYPELSRGPVQCDWKITISKGSTIDVRITKMGPTTNLCSNDVLIIYDSGDSLGKKIPMNCSSDGDITLKSSKNMIFVRYVLPDDGAAEDQQFYLNYQTNCHQTLDAMEGVIESPNFPQQYPNKLNCEWSIVGRKADSISLIFSHFELEDRDTKCLYDKFEVIDMKGDEILQTHKICQDPTGVLTSDGNTFLIKFTTDFNNGGKGFRLEYKRNGCGGHKTSTVAWFATPNYPYSVDVDCVWLIEAPPGMQIVLDVSDIHIEGADKNCSANGLIVKNSETDIKNLLKVCSVQTGLTTVTSHGSTMLVRFYSDSIRSRKYMKASYRQRQGNCGGVFRGIDGEISSPNYPQNYTENTYCEWSIFTGSETEFIEIVFDKLVLPSATNCSKGFVEIYDGFKSNQKSRLIGRYCSSRSGFGFPIWMHNGILNVILSSEDGPPSEGFVLKYKKTICGGTLNAETGFIRAKEEDRDCVWIIRPPSASFITISFLHVECHCEGLNLNECLKTHNLTIHSDTSDTTICEEHPSDINFTGTSLKFRSRRITFTAKYTTIGTACGGDITSFRGSLASPFYPASYPSNVECIWTIKAPFGNYLELNFNEMNITSSENCNQDYLEVRESSITGRLLGVFCSNALPKDNLQIFQKVWIKFRSSEGSTGKGFVLSWTNAQLNEITGFKGKIIPPSIGSIKSNKEPFQWRITVPRDNLISLSFKEYNGGLKLYDGFDSSALPVEIQMSPWVVTSSTNIIYFESDNQMLEQFIIEWKAVSRDAIIKNQTLQTCNETLNLAYGPIVTINSPGYPTGYEPNLQCQWLIKSDHPTRHAVIQLNKINLESLDSCYADYLKIFTSKNLMNWHEELKICDSTPVGRKPVTVIHGTPYLKLEFTTDSSINKTGFTANVFTACGGNLTKSIGRILDTDVLSTSNQRLIQNCTWHIEVSIGRKIQFTFEFPKNNSHISLDQCENYAIIRDGIIEGAPILPPGRICSNKNINGTIQTTSNRATIKYIMKPSNTFFEYKELMWNLTYREYSECGGEVRLTPYSRSILINSPNYPNVPNPHTECIWIIIAPPGEAVQVEFVGHFDMNVRQCSNEFIEFRDGATQIARQLGKYCVKPGTVQSSNNVLYMRYLTDIAEPRNGFKANISLSTCGGTFTQYNNIISSANYPAPGGYPSNSVCEYVIKVSTFARVNLTFLDIDLPFDAANLIGSDHIKIYQILQRDEVRVEDELAVIYGNITSPPAVQIDTNEILIRFYSFKANTKYRGFRVKYERIFGVCFKDVSGESGVLTLSIAPRQMSMFMLCRWKITVPKGKRVKLDILEIDGSLTDIDLSKNFRTTFYNDFQMLSRISMLYLTNLTTATSISSTDNKLFVRIFGAYTTSLRRMKVAYSSSEVSNCPDDITDDEGSISVANLDHRSNFFCSFDFILNGAQTLSFYISHLTIESIHQRYPSFAVRFRDERYSENLRILNSNMTNGIFASSSKHGSVNILQNDGVQIKEFEATYRRHPCGGEFSLGQRFVISMPNLTAGYGKLDCAWQLLTDTNQNGYDLTANFSFTLPCDEEFVSVHAGPSSEHMEVAKFCQGQTFNTSRLFSTQMYVYYHTESYNTLSQMVIALQRATKCSEKINLASREYLLFTSADYKNNLECVWDVQTSEGSYLQIEFVGRFFIEESKDCVKDYLEIRKFENSEWISLPRYCGRNLPSAINTTSARLQVIFRSDEANTGDGFSLTLKKTCYAVFNVTNQPQVIKYPNRWSMTRVRLICTYILQTNSDNYIQVKFKKFALGNRDRCTLTQLTAQKRSSDGYVVDMGPYCKDNAVSELRARNYISLTYQSVLETAGYEMEFFLDRCGGEVRQAMWISSLKNEAGDGYAHNMNCIWNITAPKDHNIIIQFKYFMLEENNDCSMDYVSIYKGSQMDSDNLEANLCGNLTINPPTIYIASNLAVLAAITDSSISMEGFSAHIMFSKACDERITLTDGNTPVDIDRNVTVGNGEIFICRIRATGPPGYRVKVELLEVNLNNSQNNITCNGTCENCASIEIVDSLKAGSVSLEKYCSLPAVKPMMISSFKDVVIRSNFQRPGNHQFKANLRLVRARCGSQSEYVLEDGIELTLQSYRRPNGLYAPYTHCIWKITSSKEFEIRFTSFNLQNKSDVTGQCLDYVLVRYSTGYSQTQFSENCGTTSSYVMTASSSPWSDAFAEITFHTDEEIESSGFILQAKNTDVCNQSYTDNSGVKVGLIKGIPEIIKCSNDIILPENYTVNIYFPSLYLSNSNCSENYIRVFDKLTNRQLHEDCTYTYNGRKIITSTNQVRLDLKVESSTKLELYYYGSPKSPLAGCGGNLETPTGFIFSPKYQDYKNSSRCRWNLTTTSTNRIELFFHEFNMGSICKVDYLNIIETSENGTERVSTRFCEELRNVQTYISETNRISIVSVATADFDGTGWLIYYETQSQSLRKNIKIDAEKF